VKARDALTDARTALYQASAYLSAEVPPDAREVFKVMLHQAQPWHALAFVYPNDPNVQRMQVVELLLSGLNQLIRDLEHTP
jgi:hypothetical protein